MNILTKINVDDKEKILKDIKKGQNLRGGAFGGAETTFDSRTSGQGSPQKY